MNYGGGFTGGPFMPGVNPFTGGNMFIAPPSLGGTSYSNLSVPQFVPGVGRAMMGAGRRVGGAIAGAARRVGDYILNPDNAPVVANLIGAGASIYGARQQEKLWREMQEKEEEREREARERYDSWDPLRQQIIEGILERRRQRSA